MTRRVWFWIVLAAAVACAAFCIFTWLDLQLDLELWEPGFATAITGMFFLGGYAVSLGVDALLLGRRKHPSVSVLEAVAIVAVIAIIVLSMVLGQFDATMTFVAFLLWPLGVLAAIVTTIIIGVGNARNPATTELATAAFEPGAPGASAPPAPPADPAP